MRKTIFRGGYRGLMGYVQIDSQQATRRNIPNTPNGFADSELTLSPSLMPVDTTFEYPDNSELMKRFRENHPHLYSVLNRALFRNYGGLRA